MAPARCTTLICLFVFGLESYDYRSYDCMSRTCERIQLLLRSTVAMSGVRQRGRNHAEEAAPTGGPRDRREMFSHVVACACACVFLEEAAGEAASPIAATAALSFAGMEEAAPVTVPPC